MATPENTPEELAQAAAALGTCPGQPKPLQLPLARGEQACSIRQAAFSFRAVSYTHLRTVCGECGAMYRRTMWIKRDRTKEDVWPVSYTHLDVYKRQEEITMAYNKAKAEKEWLRWKEAEEKKLRELGVEY